MKTKKNKVSRRIVAKAREVLEFAQQRAKNAANSMELRNSLYAVDGKASILFPTEVERNAFCKTKEYKSISKLIENLPLPPLSDEVIVIRIPKSTVQR